MMRHAQKIAAAIAVFASVGSAHAYAGTPPVPAKPANAEVEPKAEKRYCVVDTTTGSRIPRKVCQTRKEWLARGFDPLAPRS